MDTFTISLVSLLLVAMAYSVSQKNWGAVGICLATLAMVIFGVVMRFATGL